MSSLLFEGGVYSMPFHASFFELGDFNYRMKFTRMIWKKIMNSSYYPNRPRQNCKRGKEFNFFVPPPPPNRNDDLCLFFCFYPSSPVKYVWMSGNSGHNWVHVLHWIDCNLCRCLLYKYVQWFPYWSSWVHIPTVSDLLLSLLSLLVPENFAYLPLVSSW